MRMVKDLFVNQDEDMQVMAIMKMIEQYERQLANKELEAKEKESQFELAKGASACKQGA